MIRILFSRSNVFAVHDEELIMFLKTLKTGILNERDVRVLCNYYDILCPQDQSYLGFEEISVLV